MKVLVVTDNRYWRNELGSQRRISSLCEYLVASGHVLEVLFTGYLYPPDSDALARKPPSYRVHVRGTRPVSQGPGTTSDTWLRYAMRTARSIARQLWFELVRWSWGRQANDPQTFRKFWLQTQEPKLEDFEAATTLARFREVCERFAPQVVVVEYARLAWLLKGADSALPEVCLKLIDTHDVQCDRQSQFHRQGQVHDIDIAPAEEARALALADVVLAIQATDADKLRRLLPDTKVIVVGFPSALHVHAVRREGPVCIGFFGSSMLPNRTAAERLIHRHFPALRARFGAGVELHVFGGVCADLAHAGVGSGIHLHGFVDDLIAAYDAVDIVANPVDFGGGLKIKCVEALCHGRPLVTTAIGAEGLEAGVGSAFWLASDDEDFVSKLGQLIGSAELRATLGEAAMQFALCNLGADTAFKELGEVLTATDQAERSLNL